MPTCLPSLQLGVPGEEVLPRHTDTSLQSSIITKVKGDFHQHPELGGALGCC